jgi:hypothetical protein
MCSKKKATVFGQPTLPHAFMTSDVIQITRSLCFGLNREKEKMYAFFWVIPRRLILYADVSEHTVPSS